MVPDWSTVAVELVWLIRCLLGALFLISGLAKLWYWRRLQGTLSAMEIMPRGSVGVIAFLLPPLEAMLGLAVLAGWWLPVAGPAMLCLLGLFVAVLGWYRWRGGIELACGCFADFDHKSSTAALLGRNLLLLALAIPLALVPAQAMVGERHWKDWLQAGTVVLGVFLLWSLGSRLIVILGLLRIELRTDNN